MMQPLSNDLRLRVVTAVVDGGMSRRGAARRFGIAPSTAIKWVHAWRRTGSWGPRAQGGDRRSQRIEARAEVVLALVDETPDMTLAEIAAHLENAHGLRVSQSAVWRFFHRRGIPGYIRSDNGPEFVAEAVRRWIAAVGARTAFIEPGSPWKNGYIESFNARLRDELLNGEIFYTLKEAQVLIESWRCHYNAIRPHGSLGYRPPAPETVVLPSWPPGSATLRRPPSLAEKPSMH